MLIQVELRGIAIADSVDRVVCMYFLQRYTTEGGTIQYSAMSSDIYICIYIYIIYIYIYIYIYIIYIYI